MSKKLTILVLLFFINTVVIGGRTAGKKLLRDGFVLAGVDGKMVKVDGDGWFFEFGSEVSDGKGRVPAGKKLELLPSAGLEKIISDVNDYSEVSYRLWGRVTKYRGRNFIFPVYFLPLGEISKPDSQASRKPQQQEDEVTINEPNDVLTIPEEIVVKLQARKVIRPRQLRKRLELKQDSILADRTGFIKEHKSTRAQGHKDSRELGTTFVLDAVGWGVEQISFRLLACEVLEGAQRQQLSEAEPMRFKVSGIITEYKGEKYLLLQRSIRVYSHENFGG